MAFGSARDLTNEEILEAATRLPRDAAAVLVGKSPFVQRYVVSQMASTVAYWEAHGIVLDPVAFDIVIGTLVGNSASSAVFIEKLAEKEQGVVPEA